MALLAAEAELAVMTVVLAMTGHAGRRQLIAIEIAGVTGIAFYLCMCAPERKSRVPIVIETDRRPLVLLVAGFALGAIASTMDILNPVAIDARGAYALVAFPDVAGRAANVAVCALQRKFCLVVVVRLKPPPRRLSVATVACFAEAPFVRILRLVTIEAPPRRIAKLDVLGVTAATLYRLVGISQHEIRERVVERLAVEQDDVGVAALVVSVTLCAFLFRCIGLAAMKSPGRETIGGNVLVACEAKSRLRFARKRLVAVVALFFELGVSTNNRPGRHKLLEQVLRPRGWYHGPYHHDRDHQRAWELLAQQAAPCSEEMRRIDVNDGHDHEKNKQGQVKNMPESEQTLVECEGGRPPGGADVSRHEVRRASKLLALDLL